MDLSIKDNFKKYMDKNHSKTDRLYSWDICFNTFQEFLKKTN